MTTFTITAIMRMMKLRVIISLFAVLLLVSCGVSETQPESMTQQVAGSSTTQESPTGISAPLNVPPAPTIINDKPLYPENEVESIIWTRLPYSLPKGYSPKDLLRDQLKISYAKDNRWAFEAVGIKEVRELLEPQIEEITEVKWVKYLKEKYTSYELYLKGDFYAKVRESYTPEQIINKIWSQPLHLR